MSLLDDNLDINLKEYYTDKIVKFFKENGPNGFGFVSCMSLVEPKYLFQACSLEEVVNKPQDYELLVANVRNKYFLKIYPADDIEWGGYAPVRIRKKSNVFDHLSKTLISDILEI